MSEPIDTMAPWTIKSVSTATKDAIIKAARQEGLTVGQWLERRVQEWTQEGSPIPVQRQSYPVSDVVNLAQAAVALAGAPDHLALVRTARITVRAALLSLRGQTEFATGSSLVVVQPKAPEAPP